MLVGAAGSGKSTLAARLFAADQILSSDRYRGLLGRGETDQSATRRAFAALHRELDRRLAAGRTVVVDATNVTSFARRSLLRRASAHGVPAVAIVLDLDPALIRARNATRARGIVPVSAVDRQLASLARSLRRDELQIEGFAAIHHLRAPEEVDGLYDSRVEATSPVEAEREVLVLAPRDGDPEVGRWLSALEDGRADTLRELERVTPEMLDWRADPRLNTIGTLLYHVALVEAAWLLEDIFEGEPEPAWLADLLPLQSRDRDGRLTDVIGVELGAHVERLGVIRRYLLERLAPMTNEEFHRVRSLEAYDAAPDWILHHLLQHEAEHRAHIAWIRDTYLS